MSSMNHRQFDPAHADSVASHARRRRAESLEYRIYFALIFTCSLPIAAVRVLVPSARRRAFGVPRERRGILGEARMMANIVTPLIFST